MVVNKYFDEVKDVIKQYSATHFVLDVSLNFDVRPAEQGYLHGSIYFSDNSVLHFKEFVDALEETIYKLMYVYHYQDSKSQLIFKYDNAQHKPKLTYTEHKHLPEQILWRLHLQRLLKSWKKYLK